MEQQFREDIKPLFHYGKRMMNNSTSLKLYLRYQLIALAAIVLLGACGKESTRKPNILLITIDTTRADYLGCYGKKQAMTPCLDRLADEGTLFTRMLSTTGTTNPSHASILTGLYLARHQVYNNETPLAEEAFTLAEAFKEQGYSTLGAVSAIHLNPGNSNLGQGFDEFLTCLPKELRARDRNLEVLSRLNHYGEEKGPFFAWLHYFDPHGPYEPPYPFDEQHPVTDRYEPIEPNDRMNLSHYQMEQETIDPDKLISLYRGEISYLDREIGRVLDLLGDLEIEDETIVAVIADHGEHMTEHEIYFCHAGLYNPVYRVPLIIRYPGVVHEGLQVDTLTSSADLFPTLLELAKVQNPNPDIDGLSLVPLFANPEQQLHRFVFSEAVNGVIRSVCDGEFKFAKPYPEDWSFPESRLTRPFVDWEEEENLIDENPEKADELTEILEDWLESSSARALESVAHEQVDPEVQEALLEMGYLR